MLTYQTELTTPHFLLRAPVLSDAADFLRMRSDPLVNQFLGREPTTTVEGAVQFLEKILGYIGRQESMYWVITEKGIDKPIGTICYWNIVPALEEAEIGYELQSAYFGKGVMQEVLPAVIRFGFEVVQLRKITALPVEANERSRKLLERHHFVLDDVLKKRLEQEEDMTGIACYSLTVDRV
ncbi:GNAT family N-acetyltransferase [Chitinophaga sp.]|uniref:GNAT family N-acetyltransferase n=1 Tax=Chitinophaga sp. TaxID=1869181 RepID=UPI002F94EE63